jgi:hypothetical protein
MKVRKQEIARFLGFYLYIFKKIILPVHGPNSEHWVAFFLAHDLFSGSFLSKGHEPFIMMNILS